MNEEPMAEPIPEPTERAEGVEAAQMSEVARMTNIFISPGETFEDINRKPTWIVPIVIALVFSLAFGFLLRARVLTEDVIERIAREKLEQTLERRGLARPPEEAIQQQLRWVKTINQFWPAALVVGLFLLALIVAGVYFLVLLLLQAEARFKKVFSVVSWSWMAQAVVGNIVGIITVLLRDPQTIDPNSPVATNVAAVLSAKETAPALYAIASSLDIFILWFLILLSIGFSKISRKVSVGKAAVVVFVVWVLYALGKAGIAAFQAGG